MTVTGELVMFFIWAVCIISGAVFMISLEKVVHMVVALAASFLGLAGMYVLLHAEFVAFVQVLVYAGAVSILMIFGIMMTRHDQAEKMPRKDAHQVLLAIGSLGLFGILFFAIRDAGFIPAAQSDVSLTTKDLGILMFTQYIIPFELVSVLLTVAFIGAIILAKREAE
jgi:NADH-quinone oxidoreductase subunit J